MGGHVKIYPDTTNVYSIAFLSAKTGTLEAMSIFRSNTWREKNVSQTQVFKKKNRMHFVNFALQQSCKKASVTSPGIL